jgi:hypothetical protein
MAGAFNSWLLTQYRRKWINHRFRRSSLTKPHQKFTFVHPSDLPLARRVWMVQAPLGLHPSAFARFVTWRLQGSGTWLDTSQEHDWWSCSLKLEQHRVAAPPQNRTRKFPFIRLKQVTNDANQKTYQRVGAPRRCQTGVWFPAGGNTNVPVHGCYVHPNRPWLALRCDGDEALLH